MELEVKPVEPAIVESPAITKSQILKGYTLFEILVGLTIIALLFGFGYASFRAFSQRQLVGSTVRSIKGDLRLAQELALSGKKPGGCSVLDGYRFKGLATSYGIVAVCGGVEISINKDMIALTSGLTLTYTTGNIMFKVLGEGTDLASDATITLTQTGTGNTAQITVTRQGEIK